MALQSGANVVMPNVTDGEYKKLYELYPGKAQLNEMHACNHSSIASKIISIGRVIGSGYGEHKKVRI